MENNTNHLSLNHPNCCSIESEQSDQNTNPVYNVLLTNTDENSQLPPKQDIKIDSVVYSILSKFVQRADFGFKKYGTNLDRTDLSILDWIQHAQEEHMDAILYLEKLKKTYLQINSNTNS